MSLLDLEAKKKALRLIPHGVYVVGVREGGQLNAFTATWLTQVSFEPPLVALGVRRDGVSFKMIQAEQVFSINFLGSHQKATAQHFLKPARPAGSSVAGGPAHERTDKLAGIPHETGQTGAPILTEGIAFLECRVKEITSGGDHAVVIGEVVAAGLGKLTDPLTLKETGWHYGG